MTAPTYAALASAFPTATGPQINEALVLVASMNATAWGSDHTAATLAQASLFLSRDKLLKAPGYWKGYEQTLFDLNKARPTGESESEIAARVTANESAITTLQSDVNFPASVTAAAGLALTAAHFGKVIHATGAGAQAFTITDLSAGTPTGKEDVITVQQEGAATQVTITPSGTGVQINDAGDTVAYVATAGRTRISLLTKDGKKFYTG